jgi:prepilin-type N-terminal cleavage/methylation domain-containing protein
MRADGGTRRRFAPGSPRAAPGFTLIELMVVISIIGILMGLLFPIVSAIKRHYRRIETKHRVHQVNLAIEQFRMDYNGFPWSPPDDPDPTIDRNYVALELMPLNPEVNPGMLRDDAILYNTGRRDYLPEIKSSWLRDHDKDAGGYKEIVDVWKYPLKFRVNPETLDEAVVWSLGEPDRDARADAGPADLENDKEELTIGDETADCLDDERAENGYDDVGGMDFTDTGSYYSTYYLFGKGDTGNDITSL